MSLKMIHPGIDSIGEALDAVVFNQVWAARGWVLLDPAEAYASDLLGHPVKDVELLTVDELRGLVASRGLEYPDSKAKKAEVLKTYRDAFDPERDAIAAHPDADTAVFAPVDDPAQTSPPAASTPTPKES